METEEKQILIADTQYLITESLKSILKNELNYTTTEIVCTKKDLIRALSGSSVKLLILDYNQLDFDNFSEIKKIVCEDSHIPVLILTNSLTNSELAELNSIGIKNIILKSAEKEELIAAVEMTAKGRKYYSAEVLDMITEAYDKRNSVQENTQLTKAEIEIVKLIAEGFTTKEIARRKFNSYHTVMTHRKNIFRKLRVNNASELVMYAIRTGIIDNIEYHI
jgi:DNA-binding NarL/FixJ family response regulator